jgi:acylphosphatase
MAEPARRVRVTGRVQGVFFRAWTQSQARELGVHGWVRNASDGSVEAHLEGDEAAVKALIQRLNEGPPSPDVENVEVEDAAPEKCDGFHVRH